MNGRAKLFERFHTAVPARLLFYSVVIGILGGLMAAAFYTISQIPTEQLLHRLVGYTPPPVHREVTFFSHPHGALRAWLLPVLPALGGLLSAWIVFSLAPEAEGHGTDGVIESYHRRRGQIRFRVPFVKAIASSVTLSTGGSGGREGPITQIGAGLGSWLAGLLRLNDRDRRIMVGAGMSAGIGAIFRTPLAGAIFGAEILYKDVELEAEVLLPSMIASITSYSVYNLIFDLRFEPIFSSPNYIFTSAVEFIPFTLLAIVVSVFAVLYIKVFYRLRDLFHAMPVSRYVKPAIGGFLTGLTALAFFYACGRDESSLSVLSFGYGFLQTILNNPMAVPLGLIFAIAMLKIITTSFTIGSGGSAGVFGPSLVIGGCLGAVVGVLTRDWLAALAWIPVEQHEAAGAFVLVGMASFFAATAKTPICALIMVSELTGNYDLLVPTMWTCALAYALTRPWTIYENQMESRYDSPAHTGDFIVDLLADITVKDAFHPERSIVRIKKNTSLAELIPLITETHQNYFPVEDEEGYFVGIFSLNDIRAIMTDQQMLHLVNADDIMVTQGIYTTHPGESLDALLQKFQPLNLDELPVLESFESSKLIGMISRKDVLVAYNRRLHQSLRDAEDQKTNTMMITRG